MLIPTRETISKSSQMEATVLRRLPPLIIHPQEEGNALVTLTPQDLTRKMGAISHFNYLQNGGGGRREEGNKRVSICGGRRASPGTAGKKTDVLIEDSSPAPPL